MSRKLSSFRAELLIYHFALDIFYPSSQRTKQQQKNEQKRKQKKGIYTYLWLIHPPGELILISVACRATLKSSYLRSSTISPRRGYGRAEIGGLKQHGRTFPCLHTACIPSPSPPPPALTKNTLSLSPSLIHVSDVFMKVLTQLHNYKQIKKHFEQCNCFMFFRGGDYWTSSVLLVEHFVVAPWAGKLTFAISTAFNDQSQRHSFSRLDLPLLSVPLGCKKPL